MRVHTMQSNLTIGELSPDLQARVDNEIYYAGVAKAQNCFIMPHGGLRRRPGLTRAKDAKLPSDGKVFAFEFSSQQDYVIFLAKKKFLVFKDGELQATVTKDVPYTLAEAKEVDFTQSGDVLVVTHQNHPPQLIQRQGSHTSWNIIPVPLVSIPQYKFDTKEEDVWSDKRGWPGVCTFFQARLWFAGSTQKPNSVWGSKINGFFDFDVGTGQKDYALFDTLDSEQYNAIIGIFPGRNLMIFTSGSEFYQTASVITPESSTWKRSTGYGSRRIRPVMIDGAVLFVDSLGRTVRSTVFDFQEDSFTSPSISVLSEHLIRDVIAMDSVKGTNIDISDFVFVINRDGTMAVLNSLRHQGTEGWTEWTTFSGSDGAGGFRDVVVVNHIVYFMVEREGKFYLEYLNEGTTTDHNFTKQGVHPTKFNVVHNGVLLTYRGEQVTYTSTAGTPITKVDLGLDSSMDVALFKVILDKSMMADMQGTTGNITLERPAYDVEVGLDVPLKIVTMPLNTPTKGDPVPRNARKRVIRTMLNVKDSLGVYANLSFSPDRQFTVVLDKAPVPFTGLKETFHLGYSRETSIEIYQKYPLPFKLLSLGWELEISDG